MWTIRVSEGNMGTIQMVANRKVWKAVYWNKKIEKCGWGWQGDYWQWQFWPFWQLLQVLCGTDGVKIMIIHLLEVVWKQGLETEIWRFSVFASPAMKGVCPSLPLVMPPRCWRPLMAKPGDALDTHLPRLSPLSVHPMTPLTSGTVP